jgi:predicted transcriptional regulator
MRVEERRQLGLRVRKARERRGLSQKSVARLAGHCERYILDLENGRVDPRLGDLVDIARAFSASKSKR